MTPSARMAAGLGATRNWRTSPPMGITCATPGIESRRGRKVKSAVSRTCIGVAVFEVTATSRMPPMIEETGPICGTTFGGSSERASASLSLTNCLSRNRSVSHSNSTVTMDRPMPETERTRLTPGRPFMRVSIG